MKCVVLLMAAGDVPEWSGMTQEETDEVMARFEAFDAACEARADVEILMGEAFGADHTATVVRARGGQRSITDGPYTEAVEQPGGFYLLSAPDLDVVLELVELLPAYDLQISPIIDPD